ncbi:hypothetical protein Aduo_002040 [Ancylostoma duodenale]
MEGQQSQSSSVYQKQRPVRQALLSKRSSFVMDARLSRDEPEFEFEPPLIEARTRRFSTLQDCVSNGRLDTSLGGGLIFVQKQRRCYNPVVYYEFIHSGTASRIHSFCYDDIGGDLEMDSSPIRNCLPSERRFVDDAIGYGSECNSDERDMFKAMQAALRNIRSYTYNATGDKFIAN